MKKGILCCLVIVCVIAGLYAFSQSQDRQTTKQQTTSTSSLDEVTEGTETYRGFLIDNVYHSPEDGDIHYHVYIPDDYDGKTPYALYFTLPGYQGLYFQGVGSNLETEEFAFVAQDYNDQMIIVAPQLEDWGQTSANQTIALVEYFLSHYNIDQNRVYANGYSGGGETMSLVMGQRADLFRAYLHCSSQWDGDYQSVVDNETRVYLVVGKDDEYYGSDPSLQAYQELYRLYQEKGLLDQEIQDLLVLDIKDAQYFESQGVTNQHGGGAQLFVQDEHIMNWLFHS